MNITGIPKVAVLMATYNGAKNIEQQIDSILMQTDVSVYLYVRDDGSSDSTCEIVAEYANRYPNVFLLETYQQMQGVTRNFYSIVCDVDLSTVDYIAYSDQDDIWLSNKLSVAVQSMIQHKSDAYACNLLMADAYGRIISTRSLSARVFNYVFNKKINKQKQFDHYFEAASAGCTLMLGKTAALFFQSRIRKIFELIPLDASHDWSTYAITRLGGFHWFIDVNAYIIYRQHGSNAYGANLGYGGIEKLTKLFRSGWYRKHILMIEDLYNETGIQPPFINAVRRHNPSSFFSRLRTGFAICGQRRKFIHRVLLFFLVLGGYFR